MAQAHTSICRFCHASCPILVDVEDGLPTRIVGDKDNPIYHGYTCPKGRALPEQHSHPERLLHSQRRRPDGGYEAIGSQQAIDEVAAKIQRILERHGPRSIAMYTGTFSFPYPASVPMASAWFKAIDSRMHFTSATIDQPGKLIAHRGYVVEISSDYSSILGVAEAEANLRRGVISMPHAFGDAPSAQQDTRVREIGSNTGRLTSVERDYDAYTGIPRMSSIPVNVRLYDGAIAD